jgi:hypothetical protein
MQKGVRGKGGSALLLPSPLPSLPSLRYASDIPSPLTCRYLSLCLHPTALFLAERLYAEQPTGQSVSPLIYLLTRLMSQSVGATVGQWVTPLTRFTHSRSQSVGECDGGSGRH